MNPENIYRARYRQSHAVIVGSNIYPNESPLEFAANDAREVHRVLLDRFGFPADNATLLIDEQATRDNILRAMTHLANVCEVDDRVVFFFAGHGHTVRGRSGNVGFLVPYEGDSDDLNSLLQWKTLVATTEFIRAKHILFIMDACYSGLAVTRKPKAGATRLVADLLCRNAVQFITAGKEDELVDDEGGPRPGHSIFTGHLLDGLEGRAETGNGVITAWGLMSYVYQHVGFAPQSRQTPHYGSIDGQGDFIFSAPNLGMGDDAPEAKETFVVLPYVDDLVLPQDLLTSQVSRAKALLSTETGAIELHDLLMEEVRQFIAETPDDAYPVAQGLPAANIVDRIDRYERAVLRLSVVVACVAYWGTQAHRPVLQKMFARVTDRIEEVSGDRVATTLRWLPVITAFYAAGVAAVDAGRFENLAALFNTTLARQGRYGEDRISLGAHLRDVMVDLVQTNAINHLPAYAKKRFPASEYLFTTLQARLDDALFLGKNYEASFDAFEMIVFTAGIDVCNERQRTAYAAPGRFVYQHTSTMHPYYNEFVRKSLAQGLSWPPLRAGMLGGALERLEAAFAEGTRVLREIPSF